MNKLFQQFGAFLLVSLFFIGISHAKTIRCEDSQGKTIFTNKPYLCANYQPEKSNKKPLKQSEKVEAKRNYVKKKRHSKDKVSFRIPKRRYTKIEGQLNIFIEESLEEDFIMNDKATRKLKKYLNKVFKVLPRHTHEKLKSLDFYLMHGEKSLY